MHRNGHQLISLTADAYFIRQYHSDLSDQSALEITVRIGLDSEFTILAFFKENDENDQTSTLSYANFTDGNILLKERTYKINITYSRSVRA